MKLVWNDSFVERRWYWNTLLAEKSRCFNGCTESASCPQCLREGIWTSKCWLTKPNNTFKSCMQCAFGTWKKIFYDICAFNCFFARRHRQIVNQNDFSCIPELFAYVLSCKCLVSQNYRFGPAVLHFINVVDYVLLSKEKQQIKDPCIPQAGEGGGGPEKWLFYEPTFE